MQVVFQKIKIKNKKEKNASFTENKKINKKREKCKSFTENKNKKKYKKKKEKNASHFHKIKDFKNKKNTTENHAQFLFQIFSPKNMIFWVMSYTSVHEYICVSKTFRLKDLYSILFHLFHVCESDIELLQ